MPDDKSKPGGQDRTRINVKKDYELRDWSKKFGGHTRGVEESYCNGRQ